MNEAGLAFEPLLFLYYYHLCGRPHGKHVRKNELFEVAIRRWRSAAKFGAESGKWVGDSQTLVDRVCGEGDGKGGRGAIEEEEEETEENK